MSTEVAKEEEVAATATAKAAAPAPANAGVDVSAKILRQLEYYFSDASFPFDDYIKDLCDGEGFVEVAKLAAFPRVEALTKDVAVILSALEGTDSLEVKESKLVRRKYPVPDVDPDAVRTVHVSGFAATAGAEACAAKVAETMGKYGDVDVDGVRVLRDLAKDERALDGSAFVKFKEDAGATAAAAMNGAVRDGRKLTIFRLTDWFDRQKKKREAMAKKREEKEQRKAEEAAIPPLEVVKGAVLKFAALEGTDCSRETLKAACEPHATVKYVEYERGQAEAMVRLAEENDAQKVLDHLVPENKAAADAAADAPQEHECTIGTFQAKVSVLAGDAEADYWKRASDRAKASRANRKRNNKGGGGRGRGGGYHKAKRQRKE